jgi:PIN domain nuclease of toxin-antitoxin system
VALLFDTSILLALSRNELSRLKPSIRAVAATSVDAAFASVVSLWEIAIKTRLGKLDPKLALADLPGYYVEIGMQVLTVNEHHVLAEVAPEPLTRDPFDRLLLAQCQVEGLKLVTADRALAGHPLVHG